jgi:hypothetical protein
VVANQAIRDTIPACHACQRGFQDRGRTILRDAARRATGTSAPVALWRRWRAIGGIAIIATLCAAGVPAITELALKLSQTLNPDPSRPARSIALLCLGIDAILLLVTFPFAIFVSRHSRSAVVNQFLEEGSRCNSSHDNPLLQFALILASIGLLYGEFMLIDAIRFLLLCARLRDVDRHQAALVLAMVAAEPRGIDIDSLTGTGENPLPIRRVLVYLMAYELADIPPNSNAVEILSPAKRELRHAENSAFAIN